MGSLSDSVIRKLILALQVIQQWKYLLGKRVDFDKLKFSKAEKSGWKNTW